MKWDDISAKILSVIAACVRVDTYWKDREQYMIRNEDTTSPGNKDVTCRLSRFGTRSNGRDDFRYTHNTETNKLDIIQAGIRAFTVSALVESLDQSDLKQALEYTERIRSCMMRPQILAMFRSVNLTCTGVLSSADVSYVSDGRQISAAQIDLAFSCGVNETSADGSPGLESLDWIETVGGPGTTVVFTPADPEADPPVEESTIVTITPIEGNLEGSIP